MKIQIQGVIFLGCLFLAGCNQLSENKNKIVATNEIKESPADKQWEQEVAACLDSFNVAAARADYEKYFNFFANDAIFMGTDATERWTKEEFEVWAKPFFEKKKTWKFSAFQRKIYFANHGNIAWFDELLNTQMKICRGSGVLEREKDSWKIKQYVLSMTMPNEQVKKAIELKSNLEDSLLVLLQNTH